MLRLYELVSVKRESKDGWRETDGIKWRVVKSDTNHIWRIQVICPRCNNIGYLRRVNRKKFCILHDNNTMCNFGWSNELCESFKKIYSSAKGGI